MNNINYIHIYEDLKRGTAQFPIEFYHVDESHPRYVMELHWHIDFEFVRVLRGRLHLTLNGVTFPMNEGMTAFIPSGILHSAIPETGCLYDCTVLGQEMYYPEACWGWVKQLQRHECEARSIYGEDTPQLRAYIWELFDAGMSEHDAGIYELRVRGALYSFLSHALKEHPHSEVASHTPQSVHRIEQIKRVLEFVETHFTEPLTLDDLSAVLGMSRKYFCRFFKQMTMHSPIDYLNRYRIERACDRLRFSENAVARIAEEVGFHDLSYFIKQFKQYKGVTPKQYQIQMKK